MKKKKQVSKTKRVTSTSKIKKLNEEIDSLKEELDSLKERNLRVLAEFENYKKRMNKNINESFDKNLEKIITSFLPIFDDLSRIIDNSDTKKIKILIDSINMINIKAVKILNQFGVKTFDSLGKEFDTNLHEAIMMQDSDEKENIIINEFEKGYKIKEKIIRHSKVIVSKGSN